MEGVCYGVWGGLLSSLGGFVIRIRILMYPACILQDTRILMYLDVSQTYLTCSVTFQENTCILIFYMYFTRIPKESRIHLGYTSDTSRYMYLMRFLDVTLDTYQILSWSSPISRRSKRSRKSTSGMRSTRTTRRDSRPFRRSGRTSARRATCLRRSRQ